MNICDEVIITQNGKILGYKIQDSERTKVNGTAEGIKETFNSVIFFLYLKKSEANDKIQLCVLHT